MSLCCSHGLPGIGCCCWNMRASVTKNKQKKQKTTKNTHCSLFYQQSCCFRTHGQIDTQTDTQTHAHPSKHTHTHTRTRTRTRTHTHAHKHACSSIHPHTHTYPHPPLPHWLHKLNPRGKEVEEAKRKRKERERKKERKCTLQGLNHK